MQITENSSIHTPYYYFLQKRLTNGHFCDTLRVVQKNEHWSFLKFKIKNIQNTLEYWKDKFEKLISFLHDKLHSWYDKDDKYINVVNEMYDDKVLDDDDIENLDLSKEKDDFER